MRLNSFCDTNKRDTCAHSVNSLSDLSLSDLDGVEGLCGIEWRQRICETQQFYL